MARGRTGSLSRNTYFPGTGDQLEDPSDSVVWECVRSNKFTEGEVTVQYGLLRGKSSESDSDLWLPISSDDKKFLGGITMIKRAISGDEPTFRSYGWSESTGTWRQVRE